MKYIWCFKDRELWEMTNYGVELMDRYYKSTVGSAVSGAGMRVCSQTWRPVFIAGIGWVTASAPFSCNLQQIVKGKKR